ncbi:MAG: septal ring lytic transglycosylase RlpA family protein [Thermodesulfobacteriota bacterium]
MKGKKYYPLDKVARGTVQKGTASWYGPGFHGKATSSGEIYDMHAMTAAHSILPLGTVVRVVNLENRKNVTVRINDRGPFIGDRVLDLSLGAAKKLDIVKPGTAPVKLTVVKSGDRAKGRLVKQNQTPPASPNPFYKRKVLAKAN